MQSITTVTQKGQVTILEHLRSKFGIEPYSKVRLEAASDHVKIYPLKSNLFDFMGAFKAPKGKNALKAREYMETHYNSISRKPRA